MVDRYTVYSAVFLYKANVFGALVSTELEEIADLAQRFIQVLEEAAISDCHVAGRFGSLLRRMWGSERRYPLTTPSFEAPFNPYHPRTSAPDVGFVSNHGISNEQDFQSTAIEGQFEDLYVPTPDFSLFCPEFSSLESELVSLGLGSLG